MKIGMTTSLPIEVIFASGHIPIDLNNIFVTGDSKRLVSEAENYGFPRNICAWIKGLYTTAIETHIDELIGVVQGDCSNTHSLMSVLSDNGLKINSFSFPYSRNREELEKEINRFASYYNVTMNEVNDVKRDLDKIREKLVTLDKLTYQENKVSGFENHLWLVSSSDFNSDYRKYDEELDKFISEVKERKARKDDVRLAFLGVPPINTDIYSLLEELGGRVVFNEVQRQFSMPYLHENIIDQYLDFTYPYDINFRIKDIQKELENRQIDAVISYTQSFCHRQIDNIILRKYIKQPILLIEGDKPGALDERTKLRIESFMEMLI